MITIYNALHIFYIDRPDYVITVTIIINIIRNYETKIPIRFTCLIYNSNAEYSNAAALSTAVLADVAIVPICWLTLTTECCTILSWWFNIREHKTVVCPPRVAVRQESWVFWHVGEKSKRGILILSALTLCLHSMSRLVFSSEVNSGNTRISSSCVLFVLCVSFCGAAAVDVFFPSSMLSLSALLSSSSSVKANWLTPLASDVWHVKLMPVNK